MGFKVDSFLFEKVIALNRIQMEPGGTGQEAAQVGDSAGAFQPVKSRKRKSKEIHMETVAEPLPETVPEPISEEVPTKRPHFPPIAPEALENTVDSLRKIPVPNNRYTPLKQSWEKIYSPIVEHLKLQVRFNLQTRNVEIKTCEETKNIGAIQKAADFVRAFILGFGAPRRSLPRVFQSDRRERTQRRSSLPRHRPDRRPPRQNQIHHRKRLQSSHRPGRRASPSVGLLPKHSIRPTFYMFVDYGQSAQQSLRQYAGFRFQVGFAVLRVF